MSKIPKLNSMRFLESHGVSYEALTYDPDASDAVVVAQRIGVPAEQVYKTLVVERIGGGRPILVMIAAGCQLDLKKTAAAIGEKKVSMAAHTDAERLTGLKVGGIGALALVHKNWSVYLDQPALNHATICISAGQRGVNLKVKVQDLVKVLNAIVIEAT